MIQSLLSHRLSNSVFKVKAFSSTVRGLLLYLSKNGRFFSPSFIVTFLLKMSFENIILKQTPGLENFIPSSFNFSKTSISSVSSYKVSWNLKSYYNSVPKNCYPSGYLALLAFIQNYRQYDCILHVHCTRIQKVSYPVICAADSGVVLTTQ